MSGQGVFNVKRKWSKPIRYLSEIHNSVNDPYFLWGFESLETDWRQSKKSILALKCEYYMFNPK